MHHRSLSTILLAALLCGGCATVERARDAQRDEAEKTYRSLREIFLSV